MRLLNDPRSRAVIAGATGGAAGWLLAQVLVGVPASLASTLAFGCLTGAAVGIAFGLAEGLGSGSQSMAVRGALVGALLGMVAGGVGAGIAQASYASSQGAGRGGSVFSSELAERLREAGAKAGEIEIGLIWNNTNDLDLHVLDPGGEHIYFGDRHASSGGELDVDRNASCGQNITPQPVEHIVWSDRAPLGRYRVGVHHFANCGSSDPTPFRIEISAGGTRKTLQGFVSRGDDLKIVDEFHYEGPKQPSGSAAAVIMQVLGWTLFGLLVGAGQGAARRSGEAIRNLAIGGALGGAAGGIFFLASAAVFKPVGLGDALSLLCGMIILGCAIGLCMVVAEQALSAAVVVANGRYEGRRIALDRPTMRLGRNELFEMYLGGDPGIAQHHCTFQREGNGYVVTAEQGPVELNGVVVPHHRLAPGDRVRVGNTTLVFKTHGGGSAGLPSAPTSPRTPVQPPVPGGTPLRVAPSPQRSIQQPTAPAPLPPRRPPPPPPPPRR
jgi:hypothetical protein